MYSFVKGILSTVCCVFGMADGIFFGVRGEIGRRTGFNTFEENSPASIGSGVNP